MNYICWRILPCVRSIKINEDLWTTLCSDLFSAMLLIVYWVCWISMNITQFQKEWSPGILNSHQQGRTIWYIDSFFGYNHNMIKADTTERDLLGSVTQNVWQLSLTSLKIISGGSSEKAGLSTYHLSLLYTFITASPCSIHKLWHSMPNRTKKLEHGGGATSCMKHSIYQSSQQA